MRMGADQEYKLPDFIPVRGHLKLEDKKISKSRGLYISLREFIDSFNPDYLRYYGENYPEDFFHRQESLEIIQSLNIPAIDLKTELFDKHENPKSLFPLGKLNRPHYTEKGFELASNLIFDTIHKLENK